MSPEAPLTTTTIIQLLALAASCLAVTDQDAGSPDSPARILLDRLELAHDRIEGFESPLTYRKEYGLEGDFETRIGEVSVRGEGSGRRMILVFDRIIDVSGHGTDQPEFHMFHGGWWTEIDPRRRRLVRRQIVEPGSELDPFELGEGPLPLPFRQDPDEVERRFEVSVGEVPGEPLFGSIDDALVLHLVPRPGTAASEDHESIDLLFDPVTLLPVGIRLMHTNGDRTTAWLRKASPLREEDSSDGRIKQFDELMNRARGESGWRIEEKPIASRTQVPSETDPG